MSIRKNRPQTVVETSSYTKQAETCMDKQSREDFIAYIAQNPTEGDLIKDTGGARKIRWTSNFNQGKRGGSRVIYYYYDPSIPIFLFSAYGKNQKETLTNDDKKELRKIMKQIVESYRGEK